LLWFQDEGCVTLTARSLLDILGIIAYTNGGEGLTQRQSAYGAMQALSVIGSMQDKMMFVISQQIARTPLKSTLG